MAGVLYLLTFVSIPTLALYAPARDPNYVVGPGPDSGILVGGILEMIVALACIGTAVTLYPVVRRQSEGVALGFVGTRVLEAASILCGVAAILSLVTLRRSGAGPDALIAGRVLVALYDRLFLLSQSFIPAVNALLLGSLLFRARLVPRLIPAIGLVGAPLLIVSDIAVLFEVWGPSSPTAALFALPIAVWEFALGVWLVVKGFRPAAALAADRGSARFGSSIA